jgi:hypothetical protein
MGADPPSPKHRAERARLSCRTVQTVPQISRTLLASRSYRPGGAPDPPQERRQGLAPEQSDTVPVRYQVSFGVQSSQVRASGTGGRNLLFAFARDPSCHCARWSGPGQLPAESRGKILTKGVWVRCPDALVARRGLPAATSWAEQTGRLSPWFPPPSASSDRKKTWDHAGT